MKNFHYHSMVLLAIIFACPLQFNMYGQTGWTKVLHFNDGTPGKKAQGNPDAFDDAAGRSYYSNERSYEGGQSAELNATQGETGFGKWGGIIKHPTVLKRYDEVWFRVRTYIPTGFDYNSYSGGNRLKFLRIHTRNSAGKNLGYNDIYINAEGSSIPFSYIYEGEQKWFNLAFDPIVRDTWETYEMYVKFDHVTVDNGGQARIRFWKNGILSNDVTNRKTMVNATDEADLTYLFTYWNGSAPKTQHMWVDDIVLTSAQPSTTDANGNPYVGMGVGFSGTLSTDDITNQFENSTLVYPNPFSDDVSIDLGETFTEIFAKIHSADGKLIQENTFKDTNKISLELNAEDGIYFITINARDKKAVFKVVKE